MTEGPRSTDASRDLETRIADLERRTAGSRSDETTKAGMDTAFWAMLRNVFPEEARKHLKVAGREQLLAARVYLDRWIERLDEQEAETTNRPHEKIDIE
jgi:hypothetical protein